MTLLARDEADIVDAWLDFHLNAGADFVIATDNRSRDGTTEILERYAREGHVHLIREQGEDLRQDEWVTRMARLAATDFGADWVVNSDADEFWWPRGESLRDVLAAVPDRYGTVSAFLRVFVPRPGDGPFAERMTVRFSPLAPINDPASLYKPIRKVIHRAHPEIRLTRGNHALVGSPFAPLRGWFPVEVFHFPLRTAEQTAHKAYLQGNAFEQHIDRAPTAYHRNMFAALHDGRIGDYYGSLVVDDTELDLGDGGGKARRRHEAAGCAAGGRGRRDAHVFDPDARRGRRVRRGGRGSRRGGRRATPTPSRRAREAPAHARGPTGHPRVSEGLEDDETSLRPRAPGDRMRQTTFVILTTQRSGSGWLVDLLDDHPAIAAYEELFRVTDTTVARRGATRVPRFEVMVGPSTFSTSAGLVPRRHRYVRGLARAHPEARAVGFKLMYDQTRDHPGLVPALALMRARFIHLVRHDSLSAIVSFDIAHARDRWHYHAGERVQPPRVWADTARPPDAPPGTGRRDRAIPAVCCPACPFRSTRSSTRISSLARRRARRADRLPRRAGPAPPAAVDGGPLRPGADGRSRREPRRCAVPRWRAPSTSGSRRSGSSGYARLTARRPTITS